ncbi:unnamed protein product [Coffea canephora]|uniref:DH200=94 genomic scaffold, scaffold_195 n=1 Tax=Coffea canephora TaxID=49390 RepID=A0A068VBL6_COFCA|nr:unnamed protein product [Coffea canephora]
MEIPEKGKAEKHYHEITGAFKNNCMLHYATYRNIFPLRALAEYRKRVPLLTN